MTHSASMDKDSELLVAIAEASAWIALLHGPRRTPAAERGLQHWLGESPLHRKAFEHATETWNQTRGTVRRSARVNISLPGENTHTPRRMRSRRAALAAAAMICCAVIAAVFYFQRGTLSTEIGERRIVVLDDGTQVSLNTATRLAVRYSNSERRIQLQSGEAMFEVAKHSSWPFVVTAGDHQVTALGTSFLVRRDRDERIAVTLVEGKVAVSPSGSSEPTQRVSKRPKRADVTLSAGQRIMFGAHGTPVLDRPAIEKLTAWQQGLVNIDSLTLAEAVAEMNRYGSVELVVEGPAAHIRVSGVFRLTDSENLAKAVALTHGLALREDGDRIVLSGTPQPPSEARFRNGQLP